MSNAKNDLELKVGTKVFLVKWALTKGVVEKTVEGVGESTGLIRLKGLAHTRYRRRDLALTVEERDEKVRAICDRKLKSLERSKLAVLKVLENLGRG